MNVEHFFERHLKLQHLRLLILFSTLGQVRLIAERLNVSQPAISKQIGEMENALGAAIFAREGNRLAFTPIGETLLKRAKEIFMNLEHAKQDLRALSEGMQGHIDIGGVATVLNSLAPKIILEIKKAAPQVSVSLTEGTSNHLFPELAAGNLDVVFSRTVPSQIAAGEFACKQIIDDPIVIVCGRQHPLAKQQGEISPSDLQGWQWVLPPKRSPTHTALNSWLHENHLFLPQGCVESISLAVNERLFENYNFLGLMPASSIPQGGDSKIVRLNIPSCKLLDHVWVFYNNSPTNPFIDQLLRLLHEIFLIP